MTQAPELAAMDAPAPVAKLCRVSPGGGHDAHLTSWPFVIGRAETASLRIDSNRISREHASIQWEQGQFWVNDLGSTNGTFLNDVPVDQEWKAMHDGDVLRIADIDLMLSYGEISSADGDDSVMRMRASQEMLLHGGPAFGFGEVRDLLGAASVGVIVSPHASLDRRMMEWIDPLPRTEIHSQWLMAARAAAAVRGLPADECLLLKAPAAQLAEKWLGLIAGEAAGRQLFIGLPENCAEPERLSSLVREHGLKVACYVEVEQDIPRHCDQVWLKGATTEGIAEDDSRWQPLAELVQSATDHGVKVVATDVTDEATMLTCTELGCTLATGPYFGELRMLGELQGASVNN